MIVRIGSKAHFMTYDPDVDLIAIYLTDEDKERISNMDPKAKVFSVFPDAMNRQEVRETIAHFRADVESDNLDG